MRIGAAQKNPLASEAYLVNILGVHADHDGGVCFLDNGVILSALAEERVNRKKGSSGVSAETVIACLREAAATADDVDEICMVGYPGLLGFFVYGAPYAKLIGFTRGRSLIGLEYFVGGELTRQGGLAAVVSNLALATGLPKWFLNYLRPRFLLRRMFPKAKFRILHHHDGHSQGAYFCSGFERCLNVVVEGLDNKDCLVIERYGPEGQTPITASPWPHSPGFFYIFATQLLGFNPYTHSGKITGLAAYGDPEACLDKVERLMWTEGLELRVHPDIYTWRARYAAALAKGKIWTPEAFKPYQREDIAAAFQRRFEDCLAEIVRCSLELTGERKLVLSGGCAANVRLNQILYELPGVQEIFIMPPMGDVGQPIGLAMAGCLANGIPLAPRRLENVYFGPGYSEAEIEAALVQGRLSYSRPDDLEALVAQLIFHGNVVARFNGRMEFGPRALGNRSILYHCSDPEVNLWLNQRLGRTEFMPFAPAVLAEEAARCFENLQGCAYAAQFMTITCDATPFMRDVCPAAVHIDGTARPQLVTRLGNPSFYRIIAEYHRISNIPCIINTSFNMHDEPIVMTPSDAVRAFSLGRLDYLAIGPFLARGAKPEVFLQTSRSPDSRY